jgi:hypothetical protein
MTGFTSATKSDILAISKTYEYHTVTCSAVISLVYSFTIGNDAFRRHICFKTEIYMYQAIWSLLAMCGPSRWIKE